jgi:hypothetical protein
MPEEPLYYLVENRNGFEEPLRAGTEPEFAKEHRLLDAEADAEKGDCRQTGSKYYLVLKDVWDREHCPLIPVDLS